MPLSRRRFLATLAITPTLSARSQGSLIDTHIHLFATDQKKFPYHRNAVYKPPPSTLENYVAFIKQATIDGAVVVHPEPYQDDHTYLEYCFANEPSPGFFRGTCLFDPIASDTPEKMKALVLRNRGRIIALRIHVNRQAGVPPTTSGAIRDRDLRHPAMKTTWRAAHDLGLAIQMHMIPLHAPEVAALASEFRDTTVIIDHLSRAGQGTPEQYSKVLELAKFPRVIMKFSGVRYSSKQEYPYLDAQPLVQRTFQAFGPDRMIWGGLGMNMADFKKNIEMFNTMFAFASAADRAKISGLSDENKTASNGDAWALLDAKLNRSRAR